MKMVHHLCASAQKKPQHQPHRRQREPLRMRETVDFHFSWQNVCNFIWRDACVVRMGPLAIILYAIALHTHNVHTKAISIAERRRIHVRKIDWKSRLMGLSTAHSSSRHSTVGQSSQRLACSWYISYNFQTWIIHAIPSNAWHSSGVHRQWPHRHFYFYTKERKKINCKAFDRCVMIVCMRI